MLQAVKTSIWKNRYDISSDGRPAAAWAPSLWLTGGTLTIEGVPYRVRNGVLGSTYTMTHPDGGTVATARGAGRRTWSIETPDGVRYDLRRVSIWSSEQRLVSGGQSVGSIRRMGFWRSAVTADLPGMPLPLQVFTLAVLVTVWARNANRAGGAASVAAAGGAAAG